MSPLVSNASHRTLKLHEWLTLFVLLLLCNGVHATTVYKCTDATGAVAYQSTACAASQRTSEIELAPAPPAAPSPTYALETTRTMSTHRREVRIAHAKAEMAYECQTGAGDVFYRLSRCPHSVGEKKSSDRHDANATHRASVSSHPVTRATACSEMHRAGAVGRKGHEYDESISTYDRNLGKDPCK
jgi:Domain of unknown function (DUF4124)